MEPAHVQQIAAAQTARAALGQQAALDAAAQRSQQQVREEYGYTVTKAKTVLHPPFLVTMMLYPSTIALSLRARSNKFGLLIPTSDQMVNNQWRTEDDSSLLLTIFSFLTVVCLHAYILLHLRIRGPPGAVKMVASLAWLPTVSFWGATTSYFIAYMSMSRYGVGIGQFDFIFGAVCSLFLLVLTLFLLWKPLAHDKVVKARNAQAQAAA